MQIVQHRRRTYAAKRSGIAFISLTSYNKNGKNSSGGLKRTAIGRAKKKKDNKKREWDSCKVLKKSKNSERLFPHGENMIYLYVITAFFAAKRKS